MKKNRGEDQSRAQRKKRSRVSSMVGGKEYFKSTKNQLRTNRQTDELAKR